MEKDTVFQTTKIYSDSKKKKKLVTSLAITATQTAILVSREIGKHPTVGNVRQFTLLLNFWRYGFCRTLRTAPVPFGNTDTRAILVVRSVFTCDGK